MDSEPERTTEIMQLCNWLLPYTPRIVTSKYINRTRYEI
ncbi:Uncharacterised protein [Sphingobacterium mizutaii]|uniref:Uncharacterized protein n=1 Tax=Sphingobacterium mizutaii TaxID=1010 RepID=A0AAJ4XAM2_9SPHI|nr:Uncharacterised protein [Sphingobacterium mizutaii]